MPKCCIPTRVQFVNASTTTIAYPQSLRDKYGPQPRVYVYYRDPATNELYLSPFFTVMHFTGTSINIDHGGPNTGIVVVT